jgi:hypothetical protein
LPSAQNKLNSFVNEQKQLLVALRLQGKEGSDSYAEIEKSIKEANVELKKMDDATKAVNASFQEVESSAGGIGGVFQGLKGGLNDAFSGGLIGSLIGGGLAGGIQAGLGAVVDGFGAIIDGGRELVAAQGNLQAATGASGEEFEALKASAEDAFIGGVGGSLAEATKAIANAKASLQDALPNDQIGEFVKNAAALGTLYDKDVNEVINKSAPFVRQFGLEGQEAFNLIAFAAKEGKTSQDDVLDTIAEYSGLLQEAGFSAEEFAAQIAVAGQEGLFTTDKIGDSIKEAQIRLKAGDTAKAIADIQGSLPKAMGATLKELEGLATSGQISIKEFLERSGGAIEEAFSAGDISEAMRSQLQVAIAGTPAEDLGAEAYARMFGAPIPKEEIAAKALQAGKEAQNAAGQYLTFDAFSKKLELAFQQASQSIVLALDGVFKTLTPIIDFVSANLGTIATVVGTIAAAFAGYNIVVGISTAATAAYAAVQTALGGSISIATVAQYAWNLAMSLNPIGAVVAALAVLGAGIYAITDALSVSAEETREQAEANVELIQTQKKANEEQTTMTKGTKSMADEFIKLSEKKKLTNAETARMKQLTGDLSKEYPDLVKNTASYKDNLDGVEAIAKRAGSSLDNLAQESAKLDKALMAANQTLSFAKRNEAIEAAQNATENLVGYVTDPNARKAIDEFASALYDSKTAGAAADALNKATRSGFLNAEQMQAVTSAYTSQVQALDAYKKKADTVVEVNKKINDTTGGGGGKGSTTASEKESELEQLKKFYKGRQDELKNDIEREVNSEKNRGKDLKAIRAQLEAEANVELKKYLNERIGGITDANVFLEKNQLTAKITPSKKKGETVADIDNFYTQEMAKLSKQVDVKVVVDMTWRDEVLKELGEFVKEAENTGKEYSKNLESLFKTPAKTAEELASAENAFTNFNQMLIDEQVLLQEKIQLARDVGDTKSLESLTKLQQANQSTLDDMYRRYARFSEDSAKEIEKSTGFAGIFYTFQAALNDAFNTEKIMKERETNEQIRQERLGALNAEEDDLTKSLAKREISFEDYAAKIADIDKARQDAMEATETTFMERMKGVMDQTVGNVLKGQASNISGFVTDQFKDTEGNVSETGKIIGNLMGNLATQFGELALSGKATLADFAKSSVMVAYQALQQMIPIFIAEIAGKQFAELGLLGIAAAAGLTIVLNGLFAAAAPSLGFKDGVVGLEGPGDERSDSIPAWLSKGESVITAAGTKANRQELEWMNNNPGMSIKDYFTSNAPQIRYSVQEDGNLIQEVRKLREETRGLGKQINRNTHVEISGALVADNNSIKAVIERDRRRNARRG